VTAERIIAATTHARYLLDGPAAHTAASPLIVGFHGYGEECAIQMERLKAVREARPWTLVSVQGLHRFYRRDGRRIAASWMTREDRDLAIADNVAYVDAVIDQVTGELGNSGALVFAGFSQGASMAYRAAALGRCTAAAVIVVGGDVPPELDSGRLARVPRAMIGWGVRDAFFTRDLRDRDERRLREAGVDVVGVELDAGHEWTDAFNETARSLVRALE
jgi:predicted esterase